MRQSGATERHLWREAEPVLCPFAATTHIRRPFVHGIVVPGENRRAFRLGAAIGPLVGVGLSTGDWWPTLANSVAAYPVAFLILWAVATAKHRR